MQENKVVRMRVIAVRFMPSTFDLTPVAQLKLREIDIPLKAFVDLRQIETFCAIQELLVHRITADYHHLFAVIRLPQCFINTVRYNAPACTEMRVAS